MQFITPIIVITVGVLFYKGMIYYAQRARIRKAIKDACARWEEEATTEYHDKNYKPIWRKVA